MARPLMILKRYVWIINTLKMYGPISFTDIQKLWINDRISEGIKWVRQTFARYKNDVEEYFGIDIGVDNRYRYYITDIKPLQLDTVANWILNSFTIGDTLGHKKEIQERIIMEPTPTVGPFMEGITDAMVNKKKIVITYQQYGENEVKEYKLIPYFIKLCHQRWHLIGMKEDGKMMLFTFSSINSMKTTDETFEYDERIKAKNYFEDCFSVIRDETKPAVRIVLRAYGLEANYIRDRRLHHSQRELSICDDYTDFELFLRPSADVLTEILGRGNRVKVLEPAHLAQEVREMHEKSLKMYE